MVDCCQKVGAHGPVGGELRDRVATEYAERWTLTEKGWAQLLASDAIEKGHLVTDEALQLGLDAIDAEE